MQELQDLMNKYDPSISIHIEIDGFQAPIIIATWKNRKYTTKISRERIQDAFVYGVSENDVHKQTIDDLYQVIKTDKIYLRTKKIERLIDEI